MSNNTNSKVKQPVVAQTSTSASVAVKTKPEQTETSTDKQLVPSSDQQQVPLPCPELLTYAAVLSIQEDKPIMMDYWNDSFTKKCRIGIIGDPKLDLTVPENLKACEKLLVKSADEYTSPISQMFKVPNNKTANGIVVMTENSIYLVNIAISKFTISKPIQ